MKRLILLHIYIFIIGLTCAHAQFDPSQKRIDQFGKDQYGNQIDPNSLPDNLNDSTEVQTPAPKLYMWRVSKRLGDIIKTPVDTSYINFQSTNFTEGQRGYYSTLGNLGSPRISHLFFNRESNEPTIFLTPLSSFYSNSNEINYTNSNIPYTNLTYHKAGNKESGDEHFRSYFSVNVNKRLAFGFDIDYLYGRGYYQNQNTAYFNAKLFSSYIGNKYQMHAVYSNYYMKTNENGGITDDRYITDPEKMAGNRKEYEPKNIPTVLRETTNRNKDFYIYLTHRYNLGFYKELEQEPNDTLPPVKEFVPVTSFIHTFKIERAKRKFASQDNIKDYYQNTYLEESKAGVKDTTTYLGVKNTIGVELREGFNKYAKAGLTAFASYKYNRYYMMDLNPEKRSEFIENEIYVGGQLSKKEGNFLHYNVIGEAGVSGKALGQFDVRGDADINLKLWKDTVTLRGYASISNKLAPFYMRHYHSKHFWWDDNMDKEFKTEFGGELSIDHTRTKVKFNAANIKNYTYFNKEATPEQYSSNIQVMSAALKQDFKLGIFHLDNEVTWQKSSKESILPLPQLTLYHNLYLKFKLAKKVLSVQLGADLKYFSKYSALNYMPATQQFYLQNPDERVEIGNCPIVNVYANFQLKQARFYVMMYHINQNISKKNYFMFPHYPINPMTFRFGISWNLYD